MFFPEGLLSRNPAGQTVGALAFGSSPTGAVQNTTRGNCFFASFRVYV